jgi:hypothetical protein
MFGKIIIAAMILYAMHGIFGMKSIIVVLCIAVVLLGLIYLNQNKILYIPRIFPNTKKFQILICLLRTTPWGGGTPPSRVAPLKMLRLKPQTGSH